MGYQAKHKAHRAWLSGRRTNRQPRRDEAVIGAVSHHRRIGRGAR